MRKKMRILPIIICLIILFTSCGQAGFSDSSGSDDSQATESNAKSDVNTEVVSSEEPVEAPSETEYYDEVFLENFSQALEARWEVTSADASTFEEYLEQLKDCVDKEKEIIIDCRKEKFEDYELQEYAIAYLNGLDKQEELVKKAMNKELDEDGFDVEWEKAYLKRYKQIISIYDNYDLKIDSKYIDNINAIRNQVYLSEVGEDSFYNMLNGDVSFDDDVTVETGDDGLDTLKLVRKNNTNYEFKDLPIYLYIIDADNNKLVERIEYVVGDWKPGDEVVLTFKRTTKQEVNETIFLRP